MEIERKGERRVGKDKRGVESVEGRTKKGKGIKGKIRKPTSQHVDRSVCWCLCQSISFANEKLNVQIRKSASVCIVSIEVMHAKKNSYSTTPKLLLLC